MRLGSSQLQIGGENVELSERQEKIIEIVKENEPITGEKIAEHLDLSRATLRPDLAILTMAGLFRSTTESRLFFHWKNRNRITY